MRKNITSIGLHCILGMAALGTLSGCFSTWQHAQESVLKVAQLLRIDLSKIVVDGKPFIQVMGDFAQQLKLIKNSLENRDFVALIDTLVYEVQDASGQWRAAMKSMRSVIA